MGTVQKFWKAGAGRTEPAQTLAWQTSQTWRTQGRRDSPKALTLEVQALTLEVQAATHSKQRCSVSPGQASADGSEFQSCLQRELRAALQRDRRHAGNTQKLIDNKHDRSQCNETSFGWPSQLCTTIDRSPVRLKAVTDRQTDARTESSGLEHRCTGRPNRPHFHLCEGINELVWACSGPFWHGAPDAAQ